MSVSRKCVPRASRHCSLICSRPPRARLARRLASSRRTPAATYFAISFSMWARSSVSSSVSTEFRRNSARRRKRKSLNMRRSLFRMQDRGRRCAPLMLRQERYRFFSQSTRRTEAVSVSGRKSRQRSRHLRSGLFVAQGDDGVDLGGATRGDVTGEHGGQRENQRHAAEGKRVVGADAVEQAAENAHRGKSDEQAKNQARGGEAHSLADHEAEHAARLRAHGHANTDFARLLVNGIGQDAVDADYREDQRESTENGEQRGAHPRSPEALA